MFILERDKHNPILSPKSEHTFESAGAFNWSPVTASVALYRAQSASRLIDGIHRSVSTIGLAQSKDSKDDRSGAHYAKRSEYIKPEYDWEKFGCEDPRVTTIGKTHYIFYTALSNYPFNKDGIRLALAKADSKMNIIEKHPVTPFNAKAMALFPKKINGKFAALLTVNTDEPPAEICYVEFDKESDIWSPEFWNKWHTNFKSQALALRRSDNEQVELGAAPIYTPEGWLVIYSHILDYFHGNKSFGIEAVLLDLKDPRKILAKTKGAFMVPEQYYEKVGQIPNIIFPSGARVAGELLEIYYGATDTHGCIARVNLKKFLAGITGKKPLFRRFPENPIIMPRPDTAWEKGGTCNPAAVDIDGSVRILYRAVSDQNISTIGYAVSRDGVHIDYRAAKPVYSPRTDMESHGCEDARAVIVDDRVHIFYTAYDGSLPRVATSSIAIKDLLVENWNWTLPRLVTISSIANKDACLVPKKINGKYLFIHRLDDTVCADFVDNLDWKDAPIRSCIPLIEGRHGMWDAARVGLACPPIETKHGWLMFYHGVSHTTHYRVAAVLLDLKDPTQVLARSALPLFEPAEEYEWKGLMPGVVFPCGIVIRGDKIMLYYGAADIVVGVATASLAAVLDSLTL